MKRSVEIITWKEIVTFFSEGNVVMKETLYDGLNFFTREGGLSNDKVCFNVADIH